MSNAKRDENDVPSLLAVSSVDGVTPVVVWADPTTHRLLCTLVGGSSSGYQTPTSGAVNGSNKVFVWATAPKAISVDGTIYQATQADGTTNWTGTTTTTFSNLTPNYSIFAVA